MTRIFKAKIFAATVIAVAAIKLSLNFTDSRKLESVKLKIDRAGESFSDNCSRAPLKKYFNRNKIYSARISDINNMTLLDGIENRLDILDLSHAKVSKETMLRVIKFRSISVLILKDCDIENDALMLLQELTNIKHIDLSGSLIGDAERKSLKKLLPNVYFIWEIVDPP